MRKVAVIDGIGDSAEVALFIEYENGNTDDIEWPAEWPARVSSRFLEQHGFHIITA